MNSDNVNHPVYYTQGHIECIDAIESALTSNEYIGYMTGNILEHIWRHRLKDKVQDLQKAMWYLDRLMEYERTHIVPDKVTINGEELLGTANNVNYPPYKEMNC